MAHKSRRGAAEQSVEPDERRRQGWTPLADVTPPQSLNSPRIAMPHEMQGKACTNGIAVAEALVGTDGRVSRVRLLKQSGAEPFDVACLTNAYRWVFKPGQKGRQAGGGDCKYRL